MTKWPAQHYALLEYKLYSISIQAHIPIALVMLHNFNWEYEANLADEELNPIGEQANGDDEVEHNDHDGVNELNEILMAIWAQYLEEHIHCGVPLHVLIWHCVPQYDAVNHDNWEGIQTKGIIVSRTGVYQRNILSSWD